MLRWRSNMAVAPVGKGDSGMVFQNCCGCQRILGKVRREISYKVGIDGSGFMDLRRHIHARKLADFQANIPMADVD